MKTHTDPGAITIAFLTAKESYALADKHGLAHEDCGAGVWILWNPTTDGTLPRGPFTNTVAAARSLAGLPLE